MNNQKYLAEFLGTLLLVCTVVGSGIMAARLAQGNDAVALLGNTIATGAILVVLITLFAPLSGAHFNPVVSLIMALLQEISARNAVIYVMMQVLGGICGTLLAHAMFEMEIFQISANARSGMAQYGAEIVATFGLLLTILLGRQSRPEAVPTLVGLYITAAYWFTASTSFANPAVTIARSITDSFSGIAPSDMPYFIMAQIAGALIALFVMRKIFRT